MDKLTYMRVFVGTVKFGSMARAAKELCVSPPMVSKSISKLEDELGVQLIVRTTRRSYLTEAGQMYFDRCKEILDNIDEIHTELSDMEKSGTGRIKINVPVAFGTKRIANLISEFQVGYPDVSFQISCSDAKPDLENGKFDLAIQITEQVEESGVRSRVLTRSQLVICASPHYLEEHGEPKVLEDLASHNCLIHSDRAGEVARWSATDSEGNEVQARVQGNIAVDNADFATELAVMSKGIIMQPMFIVSRHIERGQLKPILNQYCLPTLCVYSIYPKKRHIPAKVSSFMDFIAAAFERESFSC